MTRFTFSPNALVSQSSAYRPIATAIVEALACIDGAEDHDDLEIAADRLRGAAQALEAEADLQALEATEWPAYAAE